MSVSAANHRRQLLGWAELPSIYPADFPFTPRFVTVNGRRLAYLDEGHGSQTILMVHGNPAAGYVYTRLMQALLPGVRCVVPDLLGFGMSEKPPNEAAYALAGHIDLLHGLIAQLELQNVALVVHDWGGPIGLGAALRAQERFSHLVILNTMTEAPMKIMPIYWPLFYGLLRLKSLYTYLVKERGLFQKRGLAIMQADDLAVYLRANHNAETRAAIAAFPTLIPDRTSHPNYPLLRDILAGVRGWDIPALVMFSDRDSVFTAVQGERFAHSLPQGTFQLIAGPRHFLQYERPREIAQHLRHFLGLT